MRTASVFHSINVLRVSYFTLVRTILVYVSVIWSPIYVFNIVRIERVQNRFLRFAARQLNLPFDSHAHDYNDLRSLLNVPLVLSRFHFNNLFIVFI